MDIRKNDAGLFETDIDGHAYEFEKWGAEESLDTLFDLSTIMGRPLGQVAASGGIRADLSAPTVQGIVDSLTDNLRTQRPMVMGLFKRLTTRRLQCDGKAIPSFDRHYADRLAHMFMVARANLTVQYRDFFSEVQALLPAAPSKEAPPPHKGGRSAA